jgi:DNA processing protein
MDIHHPDLLAFSAIPGIGPARLRSLVEHFGGTTGILTARGKELVSVEGIERKTASSVLAFLRDPRFALAQRNAASQLARLSRMGARMLTCWDPDYPATLKNVYDPPPFIFVTGELPAADVICIAIVGTRSPSAYGERVAERFAAGLAELDVLVVSGLARGIDTIAHRSVVRTGGRTLAVIGSGLDRIYPPENRRLASQITERGAVISEFPLGTAPDAVNFPRRNRIISGLSAGILVVETGVTGGAMITAASALDQNREVFAIPSPISADSVSGTNTLIKEGRAKLVEHIDDILSELVPSTLRTSRALPPPPPPGELTLFEERVLRTIPDEPLHIDAIALRADIPAHDALCHLLSLELKGLVRQIPGKLFVRT